jgi:hypothetical protein
MQGMPTPSSKIRSIDLTSQIMPSVCDHVILHVGPALFQYNASANRRLHVQRAVPKLPQRHLATKARYVTLPNRRFLRR